MILTCPACGTSYFVDDARIPAGGRSVKCSNCDHRWTAMPEAAAAPSPPPAPRPAPPPAFDDPFAGDLEVVDPSDIEFAPPPVKPARPARSGPRDSAGGKVAVLVSAAVAVALLVAAAIVFRGAVVAAFPDAQAAYAGLGLPVDSLGLVIENVKTEPTFEGGRPVLAVGGSIRNPHAKAATSPNLRISLLDRTGKTVAAKTVKPLDGALPAGATRYFAVTIPDPPASVHDLEVAFEAPAAPASAAVHTPVAAPAAHAADAPAHPGGPAEAKSLPPGSPDALAKHD